MKGKTLLKKALAATLAVAMVVTAVGVQTDTAQAKTKAKKITLSATKKTMKVGATFKLKVKKVKPAKASKAVTWKTSNKKIATVSKKGVVKAKKKGSVVITAVSKSNKKVKAKCKITVKKKSTTPSTDPTIAPSTVPSTAPSAAPSASPSTDPNASVSPSGDPNASTDPNTPTSPDPSDDPQEETYTVTVEAGEGGTATADKKSAKKDDTVTVTAKADAGYELDEITSDDVKVSVSGDKATFTMPEKNVTVKVTFKKVDYKVTVKAGEGGTAATDKETAQIGDTVKVEAKPATGYAVDVIKVNDKAITGTSFTMEAKDTTVEVTFKKIPYDVTVNVATGASVVVLVNGKEAAKATTEAAAATTKAAAIANAKAGTGDTVTIELTYEAKYGDAVIEVNGKKIEGTSFVMGAEDVEITVTPAEKYVSAGEKDDSTGDVTYTLPTDEDEMFKLSVDGSLTEMTVAGIKAMAASASAADFLKEEAEKFTAEAVSKEAVNASTLPSLQAIIKPFLEDCGIEVDHYGEYDKDGVRKVYEAGADNDVALVKISENSGTYTVYMQVYKDADVMKQATINFKSEGDGVTYDVAVEGFDWGTAETDWALAMKGDEVKYVISASEEGIDIKKKVTEDGNEEEKAVLKLTESEIVVGSLVADTIEVYTEKSATEDD